MTSPFTATLPRSSVATSSQPKIPSPRSSPPSECSPPVFSCVPSVAFGHIGDHAGRKAALTLSVLAMAIPTLLIGLLPTFAQIGLAAPALLILLRLVQGLSVGGEYGTSILADSLASLA